MVLLKSFLVGIGAVSACTLPILGSVLFTDGFCFSSHALLRRYPIRNQLQKLKDPQLRSTR
jgi:hypothetical protein